jgi:hypothetical protein
MNLLFSQMMRERERDAMRDHVFGQFARDVKHDAPLSHKGEVLAIKFFECLDETRLAVEIQCDFAVGIFYVVKPDSRAAACFEREIAGLLPAQGFGECAYTFRIACRIKNHFAKR